jgi:hypothetical protein
VNADSAPYAWQITYDHLDHRRDDVSGPRNADEKLLAGLAAAVKAGRAKWQPADDVEWFRMRDGDGNLYYTGVLTGQPDPCGSEGGFEPLDDYGTPNAGCTSIEYLTGRDASGKETWEQL